MIALGLALFMVLISSYLRLADSGLGCQPWPDCYGQYFSNENTQGIKVLTDHDGKSPLKIQRVIHRLIASTVGFVIFLLFIISWLPKYRQVLGRFVPTVLLLVTLVLALTGPIRPALPLPILTLVNFSGGLLIVALIYYLFRRVSGNTKVLAPGPMQPLIRWAMLLIVLQILWGGWTSANYAGTSCTKLLTCNFSQQQNLKISTAFNAFESLKLSAGYKVIIEDKMAIIQWLHHILALLTLAFFIFITWKTTVSNRPSERVLRIDCIMVLSLLVIQFLLGLGTIIFHLNIILVVIHNLLAALLMIFITSLFIKLPMRSSL